MYYFFFYRKFVIMNMRMKYMIEVIDIINMLKNKYPKEDLSEIIKYYENITNEGNSLETEQVTILSILQTNPNCFLLDDFMSMEYNRLCNKYGVDVIENIIDGGKKL